MSGGPAHQWRRGRIGEIVYIDFFLILFHKTRLLIIIIIIGMRYYHYTHTGCLQGSVRFSKSYIY